MDPELFHHRLAWLKLKAEKERSDATFQNGFAAGLETAITAIEEGRSISYESIDPPIPKKKGTRK